MTLLQGHVVNACAKLARISETMIIGHRASSSRVPEVDVSPVVVVARLLGLREAIMRLDASLHRLEHA
jgi:hypothetical protein